MKKIVCALTVASALFAGQADYGWELTPTVSGVIPEGNLGVKNHYAIGLRLAKNLEDSFLSQVELGFDFSNQAKLKNNNSSDVSRYYLNLNKDMYKSGNFGIYGLVGAGYEKWSNSHDYDDAKDGGFGQYGLGLKYYVTDNFAFRLEARDEVKFHKADHNLIYTLGFAVDFGSRKHDAMKPMVEQKPVVVETPVMKEQLNVIVIQDDDQDGVSNNLDKCPNTPAGVVVDKNGCEKVIHLKLGVNFAFDSAKINPKYMSEIKQVADVMSTHKNYKVLLEGYTDSTGPASYNLILSKKRADSVAKALENLGVNSNKITTKGFGEADPVASNKTKAGRAENRRVDAKFRY